MATNYGGLTAVSNGISASLIANLDLQPSSLKSFITTCDPLGVPSITLSNTYQRTTGASMTVAFTPAVAVARNQDMVHRSVGRAGIVLVGEGSQGVKQMLNDERRKSERFAPGVPITEVIVGDLQGQVSIRKLQKHLAKLPKKLSAHQMREVRARLKAVGGMSMPIPKGPLPKGVRIR